MISHPFSAKAEMSKMKTETKNSHRTEQPGYRASWTSPEEALGSAERPTQSPIAIALRTVPKPRGTQS